MFNLLPTEEKEAARAEYRRRVAVVALGFTLFALVTAVLLTLPSVYMALQSNARVNSELEAFKSKPEAINYMSLSKEVTATKNRLVAIKNYLPLRYDIASQLNEISDLKPSGISVRSITWAKGEKAVQIVLGGRANNRDRLRSFVAALQGSPTFSSVDYPVSSFAKSENTEFGITLLINNHNR